MNDFKQINLYYTIDFAESGRESNVFRENCLTDSKMKSLSH